ncbi:hypothetical protein EST38_g6507 [Candolleomyces aberdarensis]|uniref:DUF155 domain-containing protein n=1 Tax=Candolleomyces aberdarensis TaxID=2316362 RepID=A0A4Q2DJH6_9AGAR|nr:hypothetical protein EST38_g6507 [Candolleomyces aberdarensis]
MTKEERKKAGFRRITAYCVAEGLKMKPLAGFLKREHNVLPRVFDEALYAMYHLPLLPGYGPQTNVRSSAPPAPIQPVSGDKGKSILTRLEEAEENGYQGFYFPATQNLINLEDGPNGAHDGFTTEDGDRPADPSTILPGVVQPAAVDEVREYDGYVTSSSLPRETEGVLSRPDPEPFAYEYNPYPSESSSVSSKGSTLRKHGQVDLTASDLDHSDMEHTTTTLLTSNSNTSVATERDLRGEHHVIHPGTETDDPGIETDPGVYRSWSPGPRKSPPAADEDEELAASIMTTIPLRGSRISGSGDQDVRGMGLSEIDDSNDDTGTSRPSMVRAPTLPDIEGFGGDVDSSGIVNELVQDELHSAVEGPSAYERQLAYERERQQEADDHEAILGLEQERLRQLEYEQALEREQDRERERQLDSVGEVVFFEYGVLVFFGLTEREERDVLEDIEQAGVMRRPISEDDFEIEECHFAPSVYPARP